MLVSKAKYDKACEEIDRLTAENKRLIALIKIKDTRNKDLIEEKMVLTQMLRSEKNKNK